MFDYSLYKGITSNGVFTTALGLPADRQSSIVMLLRLLNEEGRAMELTDSEVDELLSSFTDGIEVSGCARKQVAYAVKNEIVKGYPDKTIRPKDLITAKMYCTMILKSLGYEFDYKNSVVLFCDILDKSESYSEKLSQDVAINRDLLVGISYDSFRIPYKDAGRELGQKLVDEGIITIEIRKDYVYP